MTKPPTELTLYTLDAELSQLEWCTRFRGRRTTDEVPVLVTVIAPLLATDEIFIRRFKLLTAQNAQLEHPNILPTEEAEQDGDTLFVAQPLVAGRTLAEVVEGEGPFAPDRMRRIAAQIASALDYAHQRGVVHGNLSAGQIRLGPEDHLWLTDFGISQLISGPNLAKHGQVAGAPETLAPERVQGQGPSRQADLYALGVLCYQMLAQQPPFLGPPSTVLHAHAYRQPRPLRQVNPSLPYGLSEAIGRMLAKSVDVRYSTGAEFVRALAVSGRKVHSAREFDHLWPLVERERRQTRSAKSAVYFSMALIVTLIVTGLAVWAGYELGLKQSARLAPTPRIIVVTRPPLAPTAGTGPGSDALSVAPTEPIPTVSQAAPPEALVVLSDRLQPTATRPKAGPSPTLVVTPTVAPTASTKAVVEVVFNPNAPTLTVPPGQGLFVFYNPTGFDLIVDLTGPTPASVVVPPDARHELLLQPGAYQAIIHTPTGKNLAAKVGTFEVGGGQLIERDYYSDHVLNVK